MSDMSGVFQISNHGQHRLKKSVSTNGREAEKSSSTNGQAIKKGRSKSRAIKEKATFLKTLLEDFLRLPLHSCNDLRFKFSLYV